MMPLCEKLALTRAECGIIESRDSHGIDSRAIAMLREPGTPPSSCRITSRVVPIRTEWLDEGLSHTIARMVDVW